jgi:DNA-binding XRE family transcriptional regulator
MQPAELKALRKSVKMTQDQLADAVGLSRVTVGLMERGEAPIEKRTALAVRAVVAHPEWVGID